MSKDIAAEAANKIEAAFHCDSRDVKRFTAIIQAAIEKAVKEATQPSEIAGIKVRWPQQQPAEKPAEKWTVHQWQIGHNSWDIRCGEQVICTDLTKDEAKAIADAHNASIDAAHASEQEIWHPARLVRKAFVQRMESELASNWHKGNWREWLPPGWELMRELNYHCGKLVWAMAQNDTDAVSEFAADLANLAMKADEVLGAPALEPAQRPTPASGKETR